MANVQQKNGVYHVRFRFGGQQFKRSLKTTDAKAAKAAHNVVEVALYRLNRGWLQCPSGIDIGDFIVSGGTLTAPTQVEPEPAPPPSVNELVPRYLEEQKPTMAESYHVTQAIHLKHLIAALGPKATEPCDRVTRREPRAAPPSEAPEPETDYCRERADHGRVVFQMAGCPGLFGDVPGH